MAEKLPNPYVSPQVDETSLADSPTDARRRALFLVRYTLAVLMLPGILNFACFHFVRADQRFYFNDGFIIHPSFQVLFAIVNGVGAAAIVAVVWFAGLKILDCVAVVAHHLFAERSPKQTWLDAMYESIWPLRWVAPVGAVSWLLWLHLFFFTDVPIFLINTLLGGWGHIIAACVYGNVILRWYSLRKAFIEQQSREMSI